MLALAESPEAIGREHLEPGHFTASGFVLHPERPAVLLVHHRKLERWLQPGGHLDPKDEGPAQGAAREVAEEAGLTNLDQVGALFDIDIHVFPGQPAGDPRHEHFDLRYLFRCSDDEVEGDGAEILGHRWVTHAQARAELMEPSLLRPISKALDHP